MHDANTTASVSWSNVPAAAYAHAIAPSTITATTGTRGVWPSGGGVRARDRAFDDHRDDRHARGLAQPRERARRESVERDRIRHARAGEDRAVHRRDRADRHRRGEHDLRGVTEKLARRALRDRG